jgi:predicted ATPase
LSGDNQGAMRIGLTLAESHRHAVRLALLSKVLVITGEPGVGKTNLVNSVRLTEVVRQAAGSRVITNADRINPTVGRCRSAPATSR